MSEEITSRESDVPGMLAEGLVNKDIAARLGISEHTVKFHISSMFDKLGPPPAPKPLPWESGAGPFRSKLFGLQAYSVPSPTSR